MTTQFKITRADLTASPASEAGADASQNRELMQGIEQTLDRADAQAVSAHTPYDDGKISREDWRELALSRYATMTETAAERDQAREQVKTLLAACKDAVKHGYNPPSIDAAIASVESEEAK